MAVNVVGEYVDDIVLLFGVRSEVRGQHAVRGRRQLTRVQLIVISSDKESG